METVLDNLPQAELFLKDLVLIPLSKIALQQTCWSCLSYEIFLLRSPEKKSSSGRDKHSSGRDRDRGGNRDRDRHHHHSDKRKREASSSSSKHKSPKKSRR